MNTVVTVLRSGGEFKPEHVTAMQRQVARWSAPNTRFVCLSDQPIPGVNTVPLKYDWPGWWAKMELFRMDLGLGDFLFTDLDNVILGPIDELFNCRGMTLQKGGWTALMFVPHDVGKAVIWGEFMQDPEGYMEYYAQENRPQLNGVGNYGDAGFISSVMTYETWEDILPGQTMNIASMRVSTPFGPRWLDEWPKGTRVMLCGQPHRPWKMKMFWKLRLYGESI